MEINFLTALQGGVQRQGVCTTTLPGGAGRASSSPLPGSVFAAPLGSSLHRSSLCLHLHPTSPPLFQIPLIFLLKNGGSDGKESPCNAGDLGSIPGFGRFPWRRKWQPAPVFLPRESHGQGSLEGYSP